MDTSDIRPTSSIGRAHKMDQISSFDTGHGKSPTSDEYSILDDQHPLKEIPSMKKERALQLLRIYITTLERLGHKYSTAANYRGLQIGSAPSVTDCSSEMTTRSAASTFSSVGSSISSAQTSIFSLADGSEQDSKSFRRLPEDLRARKALMRYIGCCAACSRRRTRCLLTHHDFKSLENDPRLSDQARADIKWAYEQGATEAVAVQSIEDFATPLDDSLVQLSLVEDRSSIDEVIKEVDEVFQIPPTTKSWDRGSDVPNDSGYGSLYPQALDITHYSSDRLSSQAGAVGDPTKYRPYLSLVLVQSYPGAPIQFLPPEGTPGFVSAVHHYDQSEDTLQNKLARIISNFETWREFFCPLGRATRRLDTTPVTTIEDTGIMATSKNAHNGVEVDIDKTNQHIGSVSSVTDTIAVSVTADSSDYLETRSITPSTTFSQDFVEEPSSSEILHAYISFAQHTGFTEATPSSGSSSNSKGASQGNDSGKPQTSQTTLSSKKRGRDGDDDSNEWNGGTKRSKISGSPDHDSDAGCSFICPFFAFSLVMRYGCACSNRSFKSMNSLRAHIFADHREFQCELCHEIFPKEITLTTHKDSGCIEVFWCKQCLQGFPRIEKLENHWCRKAVIPRCSQCLERFSSQDHRDRHERSGCTNTPPPDFRIVDDILYDNIKKSLEKKHWTYANEEDNDKKTWINNNVSKFSGELSHKQRELIKWIALWECFPFAKPIPDSPFRDMTIPTSDVQINEIMRKVKENLRLKLIGDDHPLSPDFEEQEEQVVWFLDSLLNTLGQFANLPKRPVPRRAKRTSNGVRPASRMPMTSTPAMFEEINHMMSDTSVDVPATARLDKQGFTSADPQHQLMPPPLSAPSQLTFNSLSAPQPLLHQTQISNRNRPLSHADVYNPEQNRTRSSFPDQEELLAPQNYLNRQEMRNGITPADSNNTPFSMMSYWPPTTHMDTQLSKAKQPMYDLRQQMYGQQEKFTPDQDHIMGGTDFSGTPSFAHSPQMPSAFSEMPDASPAAGQTPRSSRTITPSLLSDFDPYSFMGAQYSPDANHVPPDS